MQEQRLAQVKINQINESCDSLPDFVDQCVAIQAAGCTDPPLQPEQGAPQGPPAGPGAELALTISPVQH